MYTQELIGDLLQKELKGLCTTCANAEHCTYRMATDKIVIQCEMFELNSLVIQKSVPSQLRGLCTNCVNSSYCELPGRNDGVWHCEEYG